MTRRKSNHRKRDGGEEWIRTTEGNSQQIYSLPRLATSVPLHASQETRNSNIEIRNEFVSRFELRASNFPTSWDWSGRWESNPPHQLGRLAHYHYATPALNSVDVRTELSHRQRYPSGFAASRRSRHVGQYPTGITFRSGKKLRASASS